MTASRSAAGNAKKTSHLCKVPLRMPWPNLNRNYHLKPAPVSIVACAPVAEDWHARFSAVERQYLFRLVVRRAPLVLEAGKVWQISQTLDGQAMQDGANQLLGRHDFTTFRSSICQADSPVRTLDELRVEPIKCIGSQRSRSLRSGLPTGRSLPRQCGLPRRSVRLIVVR